MKNGTAISEKVSVLVNIRWIIMPMLTSPAAITAIADKAMEKATGTPMIRVTKNTVINKAGHAASSSPAHN